MQTPDTEQARKWLARILAGVLICAGFVALTMAGRLIWQARVSASWPQVPATVIQSEIERISDSKGRTSYRPLISYRYQVDGRELHGSRIYFGDSSFMFEADAREILAQYPVGSAVTASYDPSNVESAVIESGRPRNLTWLVVIGLVFGTPGVLIAALTRRRAR